jgi:tRNA G18 (ribose-2'-O)-methylase SpoU
MFLDTNRDKTRRERYNEKLKSNIMLPAAIATINFLFDENLAFMIRSAACFGISDVFVIGTLPDRSYLNTRTGSLYDYVSFKTFSNPRQFTAYCNANGYKIVSVELTDDAQSIYDYEFNFEEKTIIVLGNEQTGVPAEILLRNDSIYIPMNGPGYCLNVSQAGTAVMSEYCRQYSLTK